MKCPFCGKAGLRTVNTVPRPDTSFLVRRRRYCPNERKEFVTLEILETEFLELNKRREILDGLHDLLRRGKEEDEGGAGSDPM